MYLGYQHYDQIAKFSQSVALRKDVSVRMTFFDPVQVNVGDKDFYGIMGFSVDAYSLKREEAEEMVKDYECIHVNRKQFGEEKLFIVGDPKAVQAWYDIMREGNISSKLIRYFGGTDGFIAMANKDREVIDLKKEEIAAFTPSYNVTKGV